MITWHEVINLSDIDGSYVPESFSKVGENLNGGNQSITFEGKLGWFTENNTSSVIYLSPNGFDVDNVFPNFSYLCGFEIEQGDMEFPSYSYVFVTGVSSNYDNGNNTLVYWGIAYSNSGDDGGPNELGPSTCEEILNFNSDWSRQTFTLNTYELTNITINAFTTQAVATQTTATTVFGSTTTQTQIQTTSLGKLPTQIEQPTWQSVSYETALTVGQTYKTFYSSFANIAPATTQETFETITTFVSVNETNDTPSFWSQTPFSVTSESEIINTLTQVDTDLTPIISTKSITGSVFNMKIGVPSLVPTFVSIYAGTINSNYKATVEKQQTINAEGIFIEKTATIINSVNKEVEAIDGNVAPTYEIAQTYTDIDTKNVYLSSFTKFEQDWFTLGGAGTLSVTTQVETPIYTISPFFLPINEIKSPATINIVQELACRLNSSDNGGGKYILPTPFGLNFSDYTFEAILPVTGRTTFNEETYTFFGSNYTKSYTFLENENTSIAVDVGEIATAENSTSYHRPTSYTFVESHTAIGGKNEGEAVIPAGLFTKYFENGQSETELVSEPKQILWNNNAEITAYHRLSYYHQYGKEPQQGGQKEIELWPVDFVIDD